MKILISGGGTGGHIYPALAIAREIKNRYNEADILYVGTEEGLESELVPKEGYKFKTIRVKGFPRKLSIEMFSTIKELLLGINDAKKIIRKFQPDIVIGTGGYVCGPVVYMASRKRIPTIIHEQNAFPGITNKILSKYVDKIVASFEESKKYFKHPEKVVITGNPVRKSLATVDIERAYKDLNIDPKIPFILSFGGSGGQKKLNESMSYVIKENAYNKNVQILHVTGKRFFDKFIKDLKSSNIKLSSNIQVVPYLFNIPEALNIADLVIISAAEVTTVGVPSIIIPKAYTAENHQEYNARAIEEKEAGVMILEKNLNGELLNDTIFELIEDGEKLSIMARNSKKLGKIKAVNDIVDIIDTMLA